MLAVERTVHGQTGWRWELTREGRCFAANSDLFSEGTLHFVVWQENNKSSKFKIDQGSKQPSSWI